MIKSFSGQVAFCFAILRAISAYAGENWLSQYRFEGYIAKMVQNIPRISVFIWYLFGYQFLSDRL